jgi:tRNA(Ile)-lysidine synthase
LQLQKTYSLELIIAHVNYGLRGKDSAGDEKFVRALATKHNLKIEVLRSERVNGAKVEPLNPQKTPSRLNLGNVSENSLRDIRYAFFEKIRQAYKFDLIAVAHNQDDQAETFLMRLLRGSGLSGLRAMKFKNENVIRPLLTVSRKGILEYLKSRKLRHRTDKTNATNIFLRNKIRNKLIPYLEENYNPNIKKTLFDSTISIAEDYAFMDDFAKKIYAPKKNISVKKLLELHPAIQRRIILLAIAEKKSDIKNIGMSHIEEILKAIQSNKGKNQVVIFQGLKMTRKGDKVTISKL